jgi:metal-responsive CopG/Arc/MetJ family transcriptional regulator
MGDTMPPTSNANPKAKKTATLPDQMWEDLDRIAAHYGENRSEALRRVVSAGLDVELPKLDERERSRLELENKSLINARLRAKESGAISAVETLAAEIDNPDLIEALAQIHNWLSKG